MQRGAGQGRAAGAIVVRAHNAVMLRYKVCLFQRGLREPRLAALWPCQRPMGARRAESEAGDGRGAVERSRFSGLEIAVRGHFRGLDTVCACIGKRWLFSGMGKPAFEAY